MVPAPPMPADPDADHPKASPPDLPLCSTFRSLLMETFPWQPTRHFPPERATRGNLLPA